MGSTGRHNPDEKCPSLAKQGLEVRAAREEPRPATGLPGKRPPGARRAARIVPGAPAAREARGSSLSPARERVQPRSGAVQWSERAAHRAARQEERCMETKERIAGVRNPSIEDSRTTIEELKTTIAE